ncbi:mechanosensitive ion channel family protein [Crocinitomix algicola]|uniref:mechanosensitive ion channel family protein n=1 Tax=Crocinitomix algicola TaxID=1740263 RepID=UPI00082B5310|nr:mechanosensitive ion channel domain-containing protein [Crocinitomix algicola]
MQEETIATNEVAAEAAQSAENWSFNWSELLDKGIEYGTNLVIAIAVLVIGMIIVKRITKTVSKVLYKRDFDKALQGFLVSLVSVSLKVLVVLTALSQLGVEMTSFIALLGAAGLAIGMAFSGTLGNFAGGVMLLIFRPYKIGDYIEAQGETGVVQQIQIFNTILLTVDNKTVIVPNGTMANGNITNYTEQKKRRVDFTVGIAYGDDYEKAKSVLERFIAEDDKILKDEPNFIGLVTLADSSVNITLRVWSKTEDYWDVYFRMNERIYKEFGKEGLNIPFPQMDLHVHNVQ